MLMLAASQRHYLELLNLDASGQQRKGKACVASAAVALGPQQQQLQLQLPPGWPLPADKCEVWVLTSTSGEIVTLLLCHLVTVMPPATCGR
jgi:hypothetical protein